MTVETEERTNPFRNYPCSRCGRRIDTTSDEAKADHERLYEHEHRTLRVIHEARYDAQHYERQLIEARLVRMEAEIEAARADEAVEYDLHPLQNLAEAVGRWLQSNSTKVSGYRISHHGLRSRATAPRSLNGMGLQVGSWGAPLVVLVDQVDPYSVAKHVEPYFSPFTEAEGAAIASAIDRGLRAGSPYSSESVGPAGKTDVSPGNIRIEYPGYIMAGSVKVAFANGFAHDPPAGSLPWLPTELYPEGWASDAR